MYPTPFLGKRNQFRNRVCRAVAAACLLLLLPTALCAATIYPVRRGSVESLFGKTDKSFAAAIVRAN